MDETPDRAPRNLVICCDGTGNVWKPGKGRTNVVKLVESLVRDPQRQLHFYDPGVGTPDGYVSEAGQAWLDIARRVGGLVWGDGVWANVAAAYAFLIHNYTPGDRIYVFGFSRGAFTARATASLVDLFGVLRPEHENLIPTLLKVYRSKPKSAADANTESGGQAAPDSGSEVAAMQAAAAGKSGAAPKRTRRDIGSSLRMSFSYDEETPVHFIGVWDTVESVGLQQLALGTQITSSPTVKPAYRHVRHALALDELRWAYTPRVYTDPQLTGDERTFKQVWFAGAHSDIGGGYAETGLANATFHWMLREASLQGLLIDFTEVDRHPVNTLGLLHSETARLPLWTAVGAFRRKYPQGMCVHESVYERMKNQDAKYRPYLRPDAVPAQTSPTYIDAFRGELSAPPRTRAIAAAPPKDGWKAWTIAWFVASLALTLWAFSRSIGDEMALARMQFFDGWRGTLGAVLADWQAVSGVSVDRLLCLDSWAVFCYAAFLPIASFALLRIGGRDGAASPMIGNVMRYSAGFLPAADLLENWLTHIVVRRTAGGVATFWHSIYTAAASSLKFVLLVAFLGAAFACVVSRVRERASG